MAIIAPEGKLVFPLGIYEQPRNPNESRKWKGAGINLLRCGGTASRR